MSDANLGDEANGRLSDRARSGYAVEVCRCEEGAYLGARKAGTPCRCERCGFMTADQLAAIVREHAERAWDEGFTLADRLWQGSEYNEVTWAPDLTANPYRAARQEQNR